MGGKASASTKRRRVDEGQPGIGVDFRGDGTIDPTKNVLDLVRAGAEYQNAMRDAEARISVIRSEAETRRIDDLAEAERRRIDGLAALRSQYDTRIAEDLRVGVKTTSEQLASQLIKETGSLSNLIGALRTEFGSQISALTTSFTNQFTSGINALTPRIADLERFRWESGGKTSVSDPATAEALQRMASSITALSTTTTDAMNKTTTATAEAIAKLTVTLSGMREVESGVGGVRKGMTDSNARMLAIIMTVSTVASVFIAGIAVILAMRGIK